MKKVICNEIPPMSHTRWNLLLKKKHETRFRELFGFSMHSFFSPHFGFDIVRLNDYMEVPDDKALSAAIEERYGKEAVDLVYDMLSSPPAPDPVETAVNLSLDLDSVKAASFEQCEYEFSGSKELLRGTGWYYKGLIVHRPHAELGLQFDFGWNVSSWQGMMAMRLEKLAEAKLFATMLAESFDFEEANSFAFTEKQNKAIERVYEYWRNNHA